MRYGVDKPLEAEANRIIKESLRGVTSHAAKRDILTKDKAEDRRRREVFVRSGTPDPSVRSGMFHRSVNKANPQLNSRDGLSRARPQGYDVGSLGDVPSLDLFDSD